MQTTTRQLFNRFGVAAMALVLGLGALNLSHASAAPADGAATFKAKCATCHGVDASGNTPMGQKLKIQDLRSPEVQKHSDEDLTEIISKGKPPMPGYGKTLTPAAISQLVAYIRSIASKS
jgi:mono/diheme cytochrome c family protein